MGMAAAWLLHGHVVYMGMAAAWACCFVRALVNDVNFEDFKFISHLGTGHTRVPPVLRVLVRVRTTAVVDSTRVY